MPASVDIDGTAHCELSRQDSRCLQKISYFHLWRSINLKSFFLSFDTATPPSRGLRAAGLRLTVNYNAKCSWGECLTFRPAEFCYSSFLLLKILITKLVHDGTGSMCCFGMVTEYTSIFFHLYKERQLL